MEDKYKGVGDMWTTIRGHELFLYHYLSWNKEMPLSNPWTTNLGRLVVPNIFLNLRLLELLTRKYNKEKRYIQLPNGDPFIQISVGSIQEVLGMTYEPYMPLSFIDLEE